MELIPVSVGEYQFGFDIACAICAQSVADLSDAFLEWDEDACPEPQVVHKACAYPLNRRIRGRAEWWHCDASMLPAALNYRRPQRRTTRHQTVENGRDENARIGPSK